jgi:hypothetical protein
MRKIVAVLVIAMVTVLTDAAHAVTLPITDGEIAFTGFDTLAAFSGDGFSVRMTAGTSFANFPEDFQTITVPFGAMRTSSAARSSRSVPCHVTASVRSLSAAVRSRSRVPVCRWRRAPRSRLLRWGI